MTDANGLPRVQLIEESMREGMQIESAAIPVDDKLRLLDALARTGIGTIVVGSFVSPRWTPQMACMDELAARIRPVDGVAYTALALNERGRERLRRFIPPLSEPPTSGRTMAHLCDVFVRRNTNRSQADEIARWPGIVEAAIERGATEATIAINAAWGSNWTGHFDEEVRTEFLRKQHELWAAAGIPVTRVWIGDPMAWNLPWEVRSQVRRVVDTFPDVHTVHLHLHDARGSALLSAYEALNVLDQTHTLVLDTAVGGLGGCPYSGHGRMTRMIPTEDLVDLLNERGVDTGIDLDALIEAAHVAEEVVGHALWGRVSKAGARPRGDRLFAMDMPMIETEHQAQHFRLGAAVYGDAPSPWSEPIVSPMRSV